MTQDEYEDEEEDDPEEEANENISLLWNYKPKHEAIKKEMNEFLSSFM